MDKNPFETDDLNESNEINKEESDNTEKYIKKDEEMKKMLE